MFFVQLGGPNDHNFKFPDSSFFNNDNVNVNIQNLLIHEFQNQVYSWWWTKYFVSYLSQDHVLICLKLISALQLCSGSRNGLYIIVF